MQKSNCDFEEKKTEILNLIEQYLLEEKKGREIDEEITIVVYNLFGGRQFDDYIEFYAYACVSTLCAFTSTDIADRLKVRIGEFQFGSLCKMLEKMVECCWDIKGNDMFVAQLDQLMWDRDERSCSSEYIRFYKRKYERLLIDIKESIE